MPTEEASGRADRAGCRAEGTRATTDAVLTIARRAIVGLVLSQLHEGGLVLTAAGKIGVVIGLQGAQGTVPLPPAAASAWCSSKECLPDIASA